MDGLQISHYFSVEYSSNFLPILMCRVLYFPRNFIYFFPARLIRLLQCFSSEFPYSYIGFYREQLWNVIVLSLLCYFLYNDNNKKNNVFIIQNITFYISMLCSLSLTFYENMWKYYYYFWKIFSFWGCSYVFIYVFHTPWCLYICSFNFCVSMCICIWVCVCVTGISANFCSKLNFISDNVISTHCVLCLLEFQNCSIHTSYFLWILKFILLHTFNNGKMCFCVKYIKKLLHHLSPTKCNY